MMDNTAIWIAQLLSRYATVVENSEAPSAATLQSLNTLQLADAVLDKVQLSQMDPTHALQVAVIGPTQSGKSTLVNVLLDTNAAGISALAGYTVHAQGYATGYDADQLQALHPLMSPLQRVAANTLDAEQLDTYVLESAAAGANALISPAVVWDTPDFDSIDASTYTRAVLNTVAIADVIILMVSKDKYGDKSVWDMLTLMQPLQKPLLVCINKLDPQDESTVINAFTKRFKKQFNSGAVPPLTFFPFIRKIGNDATVQIPAEKLAELQTQLSNACNNIDRRANAASASLFIEQQRSSWLTPLLDEQQSHEQWHKLVETAASEAEQRYANEYLDNPEKYDTFNRALAELLTLLEIPGLAPTLARTRQLVTWPARKLFGFGRDSFNKQFNPGSSGSTTPTDQETATLERLINTTLVSLQGELLEQPQTPFWMSLNQNFRQQSSRVQGAFNKESENARKEFEPQVEAAAQQLYQQLQSQPSLLNTLRAARATADAAGIALALKSGGLAAADLVLAPAMLSVTTLLTESALGRYLDTIKSELKERQRKHINQRVIQDVMAKELCALASTLPGEHLFTQKLEPELLAKLKTLS